MASESPWAVLAERLGIITFCDGTVDGVCCGFSGDHSYECSGYLNDHRVQSLLVGETLRVSNSKTEGMKEDGFFWESFDQLVLDVSISNGDDRAKACIELLDAVNYKLSS